MARGFSFVQGQKQARAARSGGASAFAGKLLFKLADGDVENIRFIADEDGEVVYGAIHHEVPVEGRAWGDNVVCIAQDDEGNQTDDPCPGCESDLKIKDRYYVHVLWKDAPVYKRDKDNGNKIVKDNVGDPVVIGNEDQCAIWPMGPELADELGEIEESYGLASREFRVKRKGEKLDTKYTIVPADPDGGKKKPSASEREIIEESDIDLNDFIKPPSYEDFQSRLEGKSRGGGSSDGGSSGGSEPAKAAAKRNPFARNKKD